MLAFPGVSRERPAAPAPAVLAGVASLRSSVPRAGRHVSLAAATEVLLLVVAALACSTQRPAPASGAPAPAASAGAPELKSAEAPPLVLAETALRQSRYAEAERRFSAELEGKEPARAAIGLAETRLRTGRYPEARAAAEQALRRDPKLAPRAVALEARSFLAEGNREKAEAALRRVEADPRAREARLLLGELLIESGRRAEAQAPLLTLIEDYNEERLEPRNSRELALVGRAAHFLRSPRDANEAFAEAEEVGRFDDRLLLWRAELFLEKYDPGTADELVELVLAEAPNHPEALVLLAHVRLDQALDFAEAERLARRALEVNPKLARAYFVLGGIALRDQELDRARSEIERGLALKPGDLDLMSLRAAVEFVADDRAGFERERRRVLARNPQHSRFFAIVGEYADWEHRYDEIVELMREAVALDPDDANALASLGINLLRAGREADGVAALSRAFSLDPYNVRVFNTLELYEKVIPKSYVSVPGARFRIRYHEGDRPILERYVPVLLDRAWTTLVRHYGFTPKVPVGIELYAAREHFAIRTSGLPETAIQGVCFGHTLASMSPQKERFNLGMTLWHELSHVFHIQLSKSRVPRWFTEGLAEYETELERPLWTREHDPELFELRRAGRLPQIEGLNRAFTRAEQLSDIATAYYASSVLVKMLGERHGMERLSAMLRLWGEGKPTKEVFERALGAGPAAEDRRFAELLDQRLERYRGMFVPVSRVGTLGATREAAAKQPDSAENQLRLALALLRDGEVPAAKRALARARRLSPDLADGRFLEARLHLAEGKPSESVSLLRRMIGERQDGYEVQILLADAAAAAKDQATRRIALEAAHALDPKQTSPILGLLELSERAGDADRSLELFKKLTPLSEHDAGAHGELLKRLVARGAFDDAVRVGEDALWADVMGFETHYAFAQALEATGQRARARFEYESALLCEAEPQRLAEAHARLAKLKGN